MCFRSSLADSKASPISVPTWTQSMTSPLRRRTLKVRDMKVWTVIPFSGTLTHQQTCPVRLQGSPNCLKAIKTPPASSRAKRGPITRITRPWEASRLRTLRKPGRPNGAAPNRTNKWYKRPFQISHRPRVSDFTVVRRYKGILIDGMQLDE